MHKHKMLFYVLLYFSITLFRSLKFLLKKKKLSLLLVRFGPKYFILFEANTNGSMSMGSFSECFMLVYIKATEF